MKERDVEDVSPFLSVFLYYPAILFVYVGARVCMCVCVSFIPTVGPMGTGESMLELLFFHSRVWALMLKPKKEENK